MTTLKPIAWRLLMFAPALSLFSVMCSSQDTEETVHVSNSTSITYELGECIPDDPSTKEYCARLKELEAGIKKCEDGSITTASGTCYQTMKIGMPAPTPCPSGQCEPFHQIRRVCFFSEKDNRPVEILVNNRLIGTAKDVSYDSKTKERTVFFDLEKNFKNTKGKDQNVMTARFPVTYHQSGKDVQSMLVVKLRF